MTWSDNIDGESLEIAKSNAKRLRVMAGPGTGKSYAMKKKIMRLIEEENANPEKILAVTFTRTAATDLKKELKNGIRGAEKIHAMTLHSFCYALLNKREVFNKIQRIPRPLKTFTSKESPQFELSPLLSDINLNYNFINKREKFKIIKAFEAAWARNQTDTLWLKDENDKKFHRLILEWLKSHDSILIGELVPLTLKYLQSNPMSDIFQKYSYIVVDEYQDLNKAEQTLIDLLGKNSNISIVGDIDQSIYGFRFAHPSGIVDFSSRHENVEDKTLKECRRCPKKIVSIANSLIKHNHPNNIGNRLNIKSENIDGEISIVQWGSEDDEAKGIAKFVKEIIDTSRFKAGDILILSPRRLLGYKLRDLLVSKEIPVHSFFHEEALEDETAQKSFTMLTLLSNIDDCVALRFWLGFGSNDWRAKQYARVLNRAKTDGKKVYEILDECLQGKIDTKNIKNILTSYKNLRDIIERLSNLSCQQIVDELFSDKKEETSILREMCLMYLNKHSQATVSELAKHIDSLLTQPEMPEQGEFVRIMSLHKSKGLTSKVTIITSCVQGLIPNIEEELNGDEEEAYMCEQRRLFYVALTRAKEFLLISSFNKIKKNIGYRIGVKFSPRSSETISSSFLHELGPDNSTVESGESWLIKNKNNNIRDSNF